MRSDIPLSTYRLQFNSQFTFDDAAAIASYLKLLGITHVYASPFMMARKGSTHGYDIIDHNQLNPELGGEAGFARLSEVLKANHLGLILDFVPNHMGVHFADNGWWLDVLEWGKESPYAKSFDIDWDMLSHRSHGGVLLPILGTSYGVALENGDISLRYDEEEGSFSAWYFEHRLPIAPERYSQILRALISDAGADDSNTGQEILNLAAYYTGLHRPNRTEAPQFKAALKSIKGTAGIIERGLDAYRTGVGRTAQIRLLHNLLERQHYRLGHWRLATSEINYRRFFDVNSLAGLRVEDASTFERVHRLLHRVIAEDKIQGVRLDHIDGLRDPQQYCLKLNRLIQDARNGSREPFYVLIEKILGEDEKLESFPGVHGTTGYEWLNVITRLFIDNKGMELLDEAWRQASNISPVFSPVLFESKRRVLETLLASEFTVLARLLARIASGHYTTRDFSAASLRRAFELYVLHFPIYRTYVTATSVSPTDRDLISQTIEKARADWFDADDGIFDFLRDVLTLDLTKRGSTATGKLRIRRFALKVQQFTGPMMAKSLEDTAFYRYHRLIALNEVGGSPEVYDLSVADFHNQMSARVAQLPHGMTSTATHDTKRGEDARARIAALSEVAGEWSHLVGRWKTLNAPHVFTNGSVRAPSPAFEYMLYQALIGAWPQRIDESFVMRMKAYALKAAREAKLETSWLNPHAAYEKGVDEFVGAILDETRSAEFLVSFSTFARRMSLLGALNSLSQITLKATMPGVPDFYQGTEFWDLSLVDPDNRRPVDFRARESFLDTTDQPDWANLVATWDNGRVKLAWTKALLDLRRSSPEVFTRGGYRPLQSCGPDAAHVIAFARTYNEKAVIIAVARHLASVTDEGRGWNTDRLEGFVDLSAFELEDGVAGEDKMPFKTLFEYIPAACLRARIRGMEIA
ncbi:MAG: malto-oligosyltrehalose synthase [Bradyrhizobiaceae bacterium]|nr:MAG: malto-oligosyltrehalose synthase [Bradyrhizobiaceae bacterium]